MAGKLRIASFDIGKKNFAQYVEDSDIHTLQRLEEEYHSLPKRLRTYRTQKGVTNPRIAHIIDEICLTGERIHAGVYDLRDDKTADKLDTATRLNILNHLERHCKLWDTCDIFVIEQQYFRTWRGNRRSKGTEANVDAIKIAEGVFVWFLNEYPFKTVEYFGSQHKTQVLGAPRRMKKAMRKKWAEKKMREIHETRVDLGFVELFALQDRIFRKRLNTEERIRGYIDTYPADCPPDCVALAEKMVRDRQKLDDVGDACLQAQAFKFRRLVARLS